MKLKTLFLLSGLVVWLTYSCKDTGPEPIDVPDPTDTMQMDTVPMDTMPPIDTTGKALIDEIKGNYLGTCYIHNFAPTEYFDTLYNVTVTIDRLERIPINGIYKYKLTDEDPFFVFFIPEAEFAQDTVDMDDVGPSQKYVKTYQFIRSQRFLYSYRGEFPGFGYMVKKCYCTKQ